MLVPQWVAIVGYAVLVAVVASWPQRDEVGLLYPVGTVVSFVLLGLFAAWGAGLWANAEGQTQLIGIMILAMIPLMAYMTYTTTGTGEVEDTQSAVVRIVCYGMAGIPVVVLAF